MAYTILRGGRVLDIAAGTAEPADILIEDDTIHEIGPPGCAAPDEAVEIAAAHRLLHPGLVNAHTHGHGNLAKGPLDPRIAADRGTVDHRKPQRRGQVPVDPARRCRNGAEGLHRLL
jgi:cytosine/adenosine deaminase-related metal-dependent hydrolase